MIDVNTNKDKATIAELNELKRRFLVIFERQQEVNIGKRNINCLSCGEMPINDQFVGSDKRMYRGRLSPKQELKTTAETQATKESELL